MVARDRYSETSSPDIDTCRDCSEPGRVVLVHRDDRDAHDAEHARYGERRYVPRHRAD